MTQHPTLAYGIAALALLGLVVACAQPKEPSPDEVRWNEIIHGQRIQKDKPYKQSGFGDCDSKDIIHFTCE